MTYKNYKKNKNTYPDDEINKKIIPVAKHLKESVMVSVLANIVEIVVLATSADALLAVRGSGHSKIRNTGKKGVTAITS